MRTLKYAILGLLNQKEMTGYDLMKQFESTLCEFWSAKHSQIYPELKKLTEEGSVAYKTEPSDNGAEKKIYHITEEGRRDFIDWLSSETKPQPTPKDISRLKIFFCNCLPAEDPEISPGGPAPQAFLPPEAPQEQPDQIYRRTGQ